MNADSDTYDLKAFRARWRQMIRRCENPNATQYKYYGGKGVRVCDRWHDFDLFVEDMWPPPGPGYDLDRQDPDGDYSPDNVKWVTHKENMNKTRLQYREDCPNGHPWRLFAFEDAEGVRRCRLCYKKTWKKARRKWVP